MEKKNKEIQEKKEIFLCWLNKKDLRLIKKHAEVKKKYFLDITKIKNGIVYV